ncbi:Aspartyl protease [Paracidovorax anthurii]|uniref:Aspartyl protease n=1 Tax=Paracidovorax anthurii TaxID=78229 RepID=A0A328YCW0_9BURK|nr:aspartyl protease [Paracidovorax anthurii]
MQQLWTRRRAFLGRLGGLAGGAWLSACGGTVPADEAVVWRVPLAIQDPYPIVTARLQERDAALLLDTGADATVLDAKLARALGLALSDESVPGSGGSGPSCEIRRAVVPRFAIGGALRREQPVYVTAFPREFPWDGVLGADFLQAYAVHIDYLQGRLDLVEAAAQASARQLLGPAPLLPLRRHASGKLLVEAEVDGIAGWFSLDTGAGQAVTLFSPAVERLGLRERWGPGVRMATGVTTGGIDRSDCVRVAALQWGGHRLQRPVVELSLASAGLFGSDAWLGNIGGEVLRRFGLGLDASRGLLALQPNTAIGQAFPGPRAGFLWRDTGQALQVVEVLPEGPAAAAGLRVGDVLQAVNGQPIGPAQGWPLRTALRAPPGTAVRLQTAAGPRMLVLKELV